LRPRYPFSNPCSGISKAAKKKEYLRKKEQGLISSEKEGAFVTQKEMELYFIALTFNAIRFLSQFMRL